MSLSRTPLVLSLALAVATVAACSTAPKAEK